ncbi:ABC-three component system middle component 1 [Paenibacillus taichungensis]
MNPNQLRQRLDQAQFQNDVTVLPLDDAVYSMHLDADLEIWISEDRVAVLKAYTSNHHFLLNWREDQFVISHLLDILPPVYKNNLYFLLVLDWESSLLPDMPMEMNRVEKNSKICRKYVLYNPEDLERVPFLQGDNYHIEKEYDFLEKFKKELLAEQKLDPKIRRVVEGYFQMDQLEHGDKKLDTKQHIRQLLRGDESK